MLFAVRSWILLSALLVASGWILSALHQLTRAGYGLVFALAAIALFFLWREAKWPVAEKIPQVCRKICRRFKRPAPLFFLVLALLTLMAGALYVPQNNDSNEYRIPRVWHWLAEGHWHWIRTLDDRMNIAGCGFEWLAAPLMLFTKHDRIMFLASWVSYLMLPGLIFSVFTRLQVRPRVAWWWMWVLASGWCYAMQAASDANDSFAVIYALASVDFALRAHEKKSLTDLWFSLLAVALLTGAKQTNLPLVLPWLVVMLPSLGLIKNRPFATAGICLVAVLVSALPLIYFIIRHTGTWTGVPLDAGPNTSIWAQCELTSPIWGIIGNTFYLPLQNLHPPYFPIADQWNEAMRRFVLTPLGSHFQSFEYFGYLGRGASEPNAGIGLWIVLLTILSVTAARYYGGPMPDKNQWLRWARWAPFLSLLVFMAKVGSMQNARQIAAYYVLFFPALLVCSGHAAVVRRKWWQWSGLMAMLLTAAMLVLSRSRPLFPAESILLPLKEKHPQWTFVSKAWDSYACRLSVETQRNVFQPIIADEKIVGYATVRGAQEPGKWVPFGQRRVERVLPGDSPQELQTKGIRFVLVDSSGLVMLHTSIADWTNRFDGTLVDSVQFEAGLGTTATDYLVRLNPPGKK